MSDHEFRRVSYSAGCTPVRTLRARLRKVGDYDMSLRGRDAQVVTKVVNVGIDSHLSAVEFASDPCLEDRGHGFSALSLSITPEGMLVLLRRLWEGTGLAPDDISHECNGDDCDYSVASSLRSSILETLNIEEV